MNPVLTANSELKVEPPPVFFGLQGYRAKFVDTDFQGARHHFQKAAGSGGTFIIHDKIGISQSHKISSGFAQDANRQVVNTIWVGGSSQNLGA